MTESENKGIIAALHEMEVRFTERLTRIEAEASAWRKTHDDMRADIDRVADDVREVAKSVALTQAKDKEDLQKETRRVENDLIRQVQRLTIVIVVVAILSVGRLGVNIFQFFV